MIMHGLVVQHQKKLIRFFKKRGFNHWDSEELVQDVFIKFMEYAHLADCQNKSAYLYTIARSVYVDSIRKRAYSKKYIIEDDQWTEIGTQSDSPELLLEAEEHFLQLNECIDRLSRARKQGYILRYIEGYSYAEIALYRKVSVSAIEKNIAQASSIINEAMRD